MSALPSKLTGGLAAVVSQVLCVLLSLLGLAVPGAPAPTPGGPTCDGRVATIVGTEGPDVIRGTSKADVIVALGGADVITGGNGDDVICGGAGADEIDGGNGDDVLLGEDDGDRLTGGHGADRLVGGLGDDELVGANGDDALDGGRGTDRADGGRGTDVCTATETNVACEKVVAAPADLTIALDVVDECTPSLTVDASTPSDLVSNGDVVSYDVTVRNDPLGACLTAGSSLTTVGGTARVTSTLAEATELTDLAVWLEVADAEGAAVLPLSSGLRSSGAEAPAGCPGGVPEGCSVSIGDVVGNVAFPDGSVVTVPADGIVDVAFRFFPVLEEADLDAIRAADRVSLVLSAVAAGERRLVREAMTFADAQASGPVTVTAELPTGRTTASLPPVPAGEQVSAEDVASFVVEPTHPDRITATFTATDGTVTSEPAVVGTTVVSTTGSQLTPAVWPRAGTVGASLDLVVSTSPTGVVEAPVTVRWPGGTTTTAVDDGSGRDLNPDDNVWTAAFSWTPTTTGTMPVEVTTVVDGVHVSGSVGVTVLPEGVPSTTEVLPTYDTVVDGELEFLTERIVLLTAEDAAPADVDAAAAAVGGAIVGLAGPGVWQVSVPTLASRADLEAVLGAVSAHPVVLGAEPSTVARAQIVEPSDPHWPEQTSLPPFGVQEAWAFQTGRERAVTIAVVDSGVNLDHRDLEEKILAGRDFVDGDEVPDDVGCFHGSHVAGIAAASANNGLGIAGVSWGADILPVRVLEPDDGQPVQCAGRMDVIAAGVDFAVAQGAAIINMSLGAPDRDEALVRALSRALEANRTVVAAAGNDGEEVRRYPAAYGRTETFTSWLGFNPRTYDLDVIAVGYVDDVGTRGERSNFGSWVDVVAPGQSVLSTTVDGRYERRTGTSMAAPFVAGVVALMRAEDGQLTPGEARHRLVSTGRQVDAVSGPNVEAYGAVANGSFESGLHGWRSAGTVTTPTSLGPITPVTGDRMLSLSSGPGTETDRASLTRTLHAPADNLRDGGLTVWLFYNFVSEEYPEFVQGGFNDAFTVELVLPDGTRERLVDESVDTTAWTPVSGIDFPGGDATVGQSGWRFARTTIAADRLRGETTFELVVTDVGDAAYDSVGLIDVIGVS